MLKMKSKSPPDRPRAAKRAKVPDDPVEVAAVALERAWVRDQGAFDFLLSADYTEACIKELVSELQPDPGIGGVTTRGVTEIGNRVEKAALLVLAGAQSPDWVWRYAARAWKNEIPLWDREVREDPLKFQFHCAAIKIIVRAAASGEKISRAELCKRVIKIDPKLGKRNERTLARWAHEEFPEIRSTRGRKPKTA